MQLPCVQMKLSGKLLEQILDESSAMRRIGERKFDLTEASSRSFRITRLIGRCKGNDFVHPIEGFAPNLKELSVQQAGAGQIWMEMRK